MRERPCFIGLNELRETAYPSVAACIKRTGEALASYIASALGLSGQTLCKAARVASHQTPRSIRERIPRLFPCLVYRLQFFDWLISPSVFAGGSVLRDSWRNGHGGAWLRVDGLVDGNPVRNQGADNGL